MNDDFFSQFKILVSLWEVIRKKETSFASQTAARFEKELAEFIGVKYVIALASGTDALILSLKAYDIGPGDEVIIPSVSAFATAAAVRWVNAIPIFVDVRIEDMLIDPQKIETAITSKTKAIIPVHLNGKMADMETITRIANKKSIPVIEDAAQAIGSQYKDKQPGHYGKMACLSFNFRKILGTYDGGAVITNDQKIAEKISLMRTYGAKFHEIHLEHPLIGISSRLSPLHAAILSEKLPKLERLIEHTRKNYFLSAKLLSGAGNWLLPQIDDDCFINGYRYFLLTSRRDELVKFVREAGGKIHVDHHVPLPYFDVLNSQGYQTGDFPVAERIAKEAVFLPTHPRIYKREIEKTVNLVKQFFSKRS